MPQASVHEEESTLDSRIEQALLRLLRHFSGGVRFAHELSIERLQVVGAALDWHAGRPVVLDPRVTHRVLGGNVHGWLPHLDIVVNTGWLPEDIESLRSIRKDTIREWGPTFERWRQQPLSFDDRFREEGLSFGRSALRLSAERERRMVEMREGTRPWVRQRASARQFDTVLLVLHAIAITGLGERAGSRTIEFFQSEALLEIPFIRFSHRSFPRQSIRAHRPDSGPCHQCFDRRTEPA